MFFDPVRHRYIIDDKFIIGVTTVTGVIDKPALINWAVKITLEYVEACLQPNKKYHGLEIGEIIAAAREQHTIRKTDAASLGTKAHLWAESYIKGEKPKTPKDKKIKLVTNNFLQWIDEYKVKFLEREKKVYSRKYNYAGTIDFEAEINGELCIGDFKTSSGIWDDYRLQIAAYNAARTEETGNDYKASWIVKFAKELDKEEYTKPFEALYIPKEEHEKDFQAFLGALSLKRRLLELEREKKIKRLQKEL